MAKKNATDIVENVEKEEEVKVENTSEVEENKTTSKETTKKTKVDEVQVFKETSNEEQEIDEPVTTESKSVSGLTPERISSVILSINPEDNLIDRTKSAEEELWHDLTNASMHRKILQGRVESVEKLTNGLNVVTTSYKGQRIIIPMDEMGINVVSTETSEPIEIRLSKLANAMLGAEIDYIIPSGGLDRKNKAVIASRKAAMLAKIRKFYATFDDKGIAAIYPGRTVQARIINVTEKRLRVEIFGIEVGIRTTDLCWEWIGDLRDKPEYQVGNTILVKIKDVEYPTGSRTGNWYENIKVSAEARSLTPDVREENFEKIHVQGIYSGEITEIHDNTYYIHLASGVNAVAHEVAGTAIPMIKDKIVFVCTRKNVDNCVAVGIITRVIQTAFTR